MNDTTVWCQNASVTEPQREDVERSETGGSLRVLQSLMFWRYAHYRARDMRTIVREICCADGATRYAPSRGRDMRPAVARYAALRREMRPAVAKKHLRQRAQKPPPFENFVLAQVVRFDEGVKWA